MGRGDYIKATEKFIESIKTDASDPRSLGHLEKIVLGHPELFEKIADLPRLLMQCRNYEKYATKLKSQQKGIVEH